MAWPGSGMGRASVVAWSGGGGGSSSGGGCRFRNYLEIVPGLAASVQASLVICDMIVIVGRTTVRWRLFVGRCRGRRLFI